MAVAHRRPAPLTVTAATAALYREEIARHLRCLDVAPDPRPAAPGCESPGRCLLAAAERLAGESSGPQVLGWLLRELDVLSGLSATPGDESTH